MIKNKVVYTNKLNQMELLSTSLEGANIEEIESTKGLLAYENNLNEIDIIVTAERTDIKPFVSSGYVDVEVNGKALNSEVIVCGDLKKAILEASNGDTLTVQWHEITKTKEVLDV